MCHDGAEYRKYINYCIFWQAKSSRNLKYKDYFDAVDSGPAEADDQSFEDDSMAESQEEGEDEKDDVEDDYDGEEEGDDE